MAISHVTEPYAGSHSAALQIASGPDSPGPRNGVASATIDNRWILFHGGFDGTNFLNDTFVLDTWDSAWKRLHLKNDSEPLSVHAPRALHCISYFEQLGAMLCIGGVNRMGMLGHCCITYNDMVRKGIRGAAMLMDACQEAAVLQRSMIEAKTQISILRNSLASVQHENEVKHA